MILRRLGTKTQTELTVDSNQEQNESTDGPSCSLMSSFGLLFSICNAEVNVK